MFQLSTQGEALAFTCCAILCKSVSVWSNPGWTNPLHLTSQTKHPCIVLSIFAHFPSFTFSWLYCWALTLDGYPKRTIILLTLEKTPPSKFHVKGGGVKHLGKKSNQMNLSRDKPDRQFRYIDESPLFQVHILVVCSVSPIKACAQLVEFWRAHKMKQFIMGSMKKYLWFRHFQTPSRC